MRLLTNDMAESNNPIKTFFMASGKFWKIVECHFSFLTIHCNCSISLLIAQRNATIMRHYGNEICNTNIITHKINNNYIYMCKPHSKWLPSGFYGS